MADRLEQRSNHKSDTVNEAGRELDITVYTDPLCCWSWAFQPQLEAVQQKLATTARWKFRMGGLIPSWKNFHDEVNSVTRPVQMGPVWMHAGQVANMPIHHQIWMQDPPSSSYPACIGVKCAQLQSEDIGLTYLKLLRKACMGQGKNIADQAILFEVAEQLPALHNEFDLEAFISDYHNDIGLEAFRVDMAEVTKYRINRFPTLIVRSSDGRAIMIAGYRHSDEVLKAIAEMAAPLSSAVNSGND
jgi:putative protein-disulfide isomerase